MDKDHIPQLIANGNLKVAIAKAQATAKAVLAKIGVVFPHNACAATLSALLQDAGINVPMTPGAGKLAHILGGQINSRNWTHIPVGKQKPGDVGVCFDDDPKIPGADHIYLVVEVDAANPDKMMIVDNQADTKHQRFASGHGGKTPTEYFLRAP
jgi:hypothetical protein